MRVCEMVLNKRRLNEAKFKAVPIAIGKICVRTKRASQFFETIVVKALSVV